MGWRTPFTKMSPREQKLLGILGMLFAGMLIIGLPLYVYLDLMEARERSEEIRTVLRRMTTASEVLAQRRAQREALEVRFSEPAPPLASFIESAASANGLEVPESTDRPDTKRKGYVERSTVVKMRKVNLKPLVKMLEQIKRSRHPLAVSKLSIKKRTAPPDQYDVELAVSAFDKLK